MALSLMRMPSSHELVPQELLRVAVEGQGGNVGFVEITAATTLAQLRSLIERNLDVDVVPQYFQFVAPDGMLVGSAKERSTLAQAFLPCVTLLPTAESPLAGKRRVHAPVSGHCACACSISGMPCLL